MSFRNMGFLRIHKWPALNKQFFLVLITGILVGWLIAHLSNSSSNRQSLLTDPHTSTDLEKMHGPTFDPGYHNDNEEFHNMEDPSIANKLRENVRILCWIMTGPKNHKKKARHVKNTWGRRCNILLFMSSVEDNSLPTIALPVKEGRDYLWLKTKEAFKHVYKYYLNSADWFLKADDDTYVIIENLRYMLLPHKTSEPIYFGCKFKPYVKQGYMSGGAGYALSREALKRFIEIGLNNATNCYKGFNGDEDVEMGKCMEAVNVTAGDSRDSLGRERFFPFVPEHHLIPGHVPKNFWFWKFVYYEHKEGMECCSDNAVSFHYVSPNQMYVLEYLIYHLRPYGINFNVELPDQLKEKYIGYEPPDTTT
ncbi:unnamed protein product [Psylliodes chrysocephalus]|uniref:Glycoprotein-N-acetylgalactosamine 3-beta-galactosyltransferase 1 n=1 Tax=Psylliodes chrysocephalus TaxID=3402493 RepID=A0A9P0D479_9CUCU|nr:unnamed protein product [Psylliodes chrysocephala]